MMTIFWAIHASSFCFLLKFMLRAVDLSHMNCVYSLDIGMYNLNPNGEPNNRTSLGWARISSGTSSFDGFVQEGALNRFGLEKPWTGGINLAQMAASLAKDLSDGHRVALGFEAPMWFPIKRNLEAGGRQFEQRFNAEDGREWYLQSGAAATLKATSLGVLLFTMIRLHLPKFKLSTKTTADRSVIVLFESFVTGNYKIPCPVGQLRGDVWDAYVGCLAWGVLNHRFQHPIQYTPEALHAAGTQSSNSVASVWHHIAGLLENGLTIDGPPDCEVVGIPCA